MATVRLKTRLFNRISFFPERGLSNDIAEAPAYRLLLRLVLFESHAEPIKQTALDYEDKRKTDAVVDTGSAFSVFSYRTWKSVEKEIRWLKRPTKIDGSEYMVTVLGGRWAYRLGRIRLAAFDDRANWFEPVWTLALFLENVPDAPNVNILGLGSSFFKHRQLRHAGYDPGELPIWWLEDVRE